MTTVPQFFSEADRLRLAKFDWLRANRGILKRISGELGVAGSVTSRVYHQKERSRRIERRFAELGAPGFELEPS